MAHGHYAHDTKPGRSGGQALGGICVRGRERLPGNVTTGAATGTDCPIGVSMQGANDGNDADDHGGPTDGDGCV